MQLTMIAEQLRRDAPGGIGTYVRGLSLGLRRPPVPGSGEDEIQICFVTSPAKRRPDPLGEFGSVRALPLPAKVLTTIWERDRLRGPAVGDIVHATSFAFPAPRRRKPIPLSVFVHDLAWRHVPEAYPERGIRWHERGLERAIEFADALLVPSQLTRADVIAAGADPAKVSVVPEGCDHLPRTYAEGLGSYLLAVSTIEPRKNLARLIEAYARMRPSLPEPWPLRIVGPLGWNGHGADGLPAILPEGVEVVGAVTDQELALQYAGARAFAYVPIVEGFGLPPLEAMRVGLAVACSPVPSVVEPVAGQAAMAAPAVIVDPLDVDSIAAGLFAVLADDPTRAEVRRSASLWVSARGWRVAADAHRSVWRAISGPNRR